MKTYSLLSFLLLITTVSYGQWNTIPSIYCVGCDVPELLVEWDALPGADLIELQDNSIAFRSNDGTGQFPTFEMIMPLPNYAQISYLQDVDDDQDHDVFMTHGDTIYLYVNDDGMLTMMSLDTVLIDVEYMVSHQLDNGYLAPYDLDNDGQMELVWKTQQGSFFHYYKKNGNAYNKMIAPLLSPYDIPLNTKVVMFDWDGDGWRDIVHLGSDTEFDVLYVIPGVNGSSWATTPTTVQMAGIRDLIVHDINSDSVEDLLGSQSHYISHPDSAHYFVQSLINGPNWGEYTRKLDMDCDGDIEIVSKGFNVGWMELSIHNADQLTLSSDIMSFSAQGANGNPPHVVADVNADGALDLLLSSNLHDTVYLFVNQASLPIVTFAPPSTNIPPNNILLTGGSPIGGTYSGPGVVDDSLMVSMLPGGDIDITYTYSSFPGCVDSATVTFIDLTTAMVALEDPVSDFTAYPNPAKELVVIRSSMENPAIAWLQDVTGRMVTASMRVPALGMAQLQVTDLRSGTYLLILADDEQNILGQQKLLVE
ncbi:MAG: T9SS type A sorting domain-containing protein [Flavobacteriales bacterium]|nr:T9SS type A sorting domain-containing protein [Flavobacteriales bacterium]